MDCSLTPKLAESTSWGVCAIQSVSSTVSYSEKAPSSNTSRNSHPSGPSPWIECGTPVGKYQRSPSVMSVTNPSTKLSEPSCTGTARPRSQTHFRSPDRVRMRYVSSKGSPRSKARAMLARTAARSSGSMSASKLTNWLPINASGS